MKKTTQGEARRKELEEKLRFKINDARQPKTYQAIASIVKNSWYDNLRPRFVLPRRIACPACRMNGATFARCVRCGGPACDNCMNRVKGAELCFACQQEKKERQRERKN